jgi:outer membrane protein OmpA-like peptidoglycan-associated protein
MKRLLCISALSVAALLSSGCAVLGGGAKPAADAAPAAAKANVWSSNMQAKLVAMELIARNTQVTVMRTPDDQLQVNVPSDFSFDTDSAAIKPQMRPVLDQFADALATPTLSHMLVLVVGHTDDRGSAVVNDRLSVARAASVAKYLEAKGIAASRIAAQGRGEDQPMAPNDRDYGRALNRRVDLFLREPGQ